METFSHPKMINNLHPLSLLLLNTCLIFRGEVIYHMEKKPQLVMYSISTIDHDNLAPYFTQQNKSPSINWSHPS